MTEQDSQMTRDPPHEDHARLVKTLATGVGSLLAFAVTWGEHGLESTVVDLTILLGVYSLIWFSWKKYAVHGAIMTDSEQYRETNEQKEDDGGLRMHRGPSLIKTLRKRRDQLRRWFNRD